MPQLVDGAGAGLLGFIKTDLTLEPSRAHVTAGTAVDLATGDTRWTYSIPSDAQPFCADDVFGYYNDHRLVVMDTSSGRELWRFAYTAAAGETAPVVASGAIYFEQVVERHTILTAFGSRTRAHMFAKTRKGTLVLVDPDDGIVFTATDDGRRYALDSRTGHRLFTYSGGVVPDAAADGRLFATASAQPSPGR
jgi:outer membrane protein assembly factor BamB